MSADPAKRIINEGVTKGSGRKPGPTTEKPDVVPPLQAHTKLDEKVCCIEYLGAIISCLKAVIEQGGTMNTDLAGNGPTARELCARGDWAVHNRKPYVVTKQDGQPGDRNGKR